MGATEVEVLLAAGERALADADWPAAREAFAQAATEHDVPAAWEGLARAAWWQGDAATTLDARERSYAGYRRDGDLVGAARAAQWLATDALEFRGEHAVATAWLRRGAALVADGPPCAELAVIRLTEADLALFAAGDPATAERLARDALAVGREVGDLGVEVIGLAVLGCALIASGSVEEGLASLDDCAALAVGEVLPEPAAAGWALCHTVSACVDLGDFDRAGQWCGRLQRWCEEWRARHFFGICRTAYGEVLLTRGDWPSAEEELLSALEDLRTTRPAIAGAAAVAVGQLRARQGAVVDARASFEQALPLPQAVLALGELDLDAGDAEAACDAADRVLRRLGPGEVLGRFRALELLARARAAAGDREGASAAADDAERQAERLGTPYMLGRAHLARAAVWAAAGDHDGARRAAEDAADRFAACPAPYERARARLLAADALRAAGRLDRADAEARAARDTLALLGAGRGETDQLSSRELEVLRLIAAGLGDAAVAERLFLSAHTVHRHVANIRTKLRVPSRTAAVARAAADGLL